MKKSAIILSLAGLLLATVTSSCLSDGENTIIVETGNPTDIPSDSQATPNPDITTSNATIPNIQYATVDEDGVSVLRIDMTGIQDKETLEWLHLLGTGERNQNVWVEVDGKPKGIKVYNTADGDETPSVPVDLIFLVDNSGSMSEEADAIARDITSWAQKLEISGIDIMFGCVGYNGVITGACSPCHAAALYAYLQRYTGTSRTYGFEGTTEEIQLYQDVSVKYRTGGSDRNECGMAALRFADENFNFRNGANRIYVNFTDEPNQHAGNMRFSVESLKTDWDTSDGTIHTVFSGNEETSGEYNYLMSYYTGGTVINTDGYFTGVTLENLPVSDAMMNSYIIRFTNIEEFMDGKSHEVRITVYDGGVQAERIFHVIFGDKPNNNHGSSSTSKRPFSGRWECVEAQSPDAVGFTYIFNNDGSGVAFSSETSRHDKFKDYAVENGTFKIMWEGDDEWDEKGSITVGNNTFTLNMYGRNLMVFKKH